MLVGLLISLVQNQYARKHRMCQSGKYRFCCI